MGPHLTRTLTVAAALLVAAAPAWLESAAVQHFVAAHHVLDAYFPVVSGLVYALVRAYQTRGGTSTVPPTSNGSGSMGAR